MVDFELLAPAGNFDCLIAAVQSGADAVYISGKSFGARSYANNFDRDELQRAMDYCHLRDVKVYVTVNTLIDDAEFEELLDYLIFLNNIGTDAIIVQDIGVVKLASKYVPNLPIHASTQMSIHNSEGVRALEKLGIKRVVMARELSLAEIEKISLNTSAELEIFAHGALCMCYSGQCLMSSIIGGRSGNRGKCAQPCRLPYSVNSEKNKAFYMSLKDLCSIKHLSEFKRAGVVSLKIEGRMKGAAYVAAVVKTYRKYIDNPVEIEKDDIELLNNIFNRGGLTDGYITGKIGENMFALNKPDNPYRKNENDIVKDLLKYEKTENRKLDLRCSVIIEEGKNPQICFEHYDVKIEYIYEKAAQSAMKLPLSEELVKNQLGKTGGTPFEIVEFDIKLSDNAFLTASDLNALRRNGLELFETEYLSRFKRTCKDAKIDNSVLISGDRGKDKYVCEITSIEQLRAAADMPFELFYVPLHIAEENMCEIESLKEKTVLVLPSIIHEASFNDLCNRAEKLLESGFNGIQIQNIALLERFKNWKIYGGFRLNVFNSKAVSFWAEKNIDAVEISPELTLKQIKKIKKELPVQCMVYGRIPLMITENCVIKNSGKCQCSKNASITDRMGMSFPIIKDGNSCRNVILNCKKTYMAGDIKKLSDAGVNLFRLYFTDESFDECINVCRAYLYEDSYKPEGFTTAHFYKGVMQE